MMQAGSVGRGDWQEDVRSEEDKSQASGCDLPSDEFKNAWLLLKDLHEGEVYRLKAKVRRLRKERLAERQASKKMTEKEFYEQQKVLGDVIVELRQQLNSKVCINCSVNEALSSKLQQELVDIQESNRKCIAALTAEKEKLMEENKRLAEKLKLNQQQYQITFSDSDEEQDVFPCTQKNIPVFIMKEPPEGAKIQLPLRRKRLIHAEKPKSVIVRSDKPKPVTDHPDKPKSAVVQPDKPKPVIDHPDKPKSVGRKQQHKSPDFPIPFHSQDLFEVPETSMEETSSNMNMPVPGGSANQKSCSRFSSTTTPGPQKGGRFLGVVTSPGDKPKQLKKETKTKIPKVSTQQYDSPKDFSWSLSSISGENLPSDIVSETSEENMPDCNKSPLSTALRKDTHSPSLFDNTGKSTGKKKLSSVHNYNIGFAVRDSTSQKPSKEEAALSAEQPSYLGYSVNKPQEDYESLFPGSTIKRKRACPKRKRR